MYHRDMFILLCLFLVMPTFLYSQQNVSEIEILQAETTTDISDEKPILIIRTDTQNCDVFVNNTFMGKTPLTIKGLIEGEYNLEIKKENYKKVFRVQAKKYFSYSFFIEMKDLIEKNNTTLKEDEQDNLSQKYKPQYGPKAR